MGKNTVEFYYKPQSTKLFSKDLTQKGLSLFD